MSVLRRLPLLLLALPLAAQTQLWTSNAGLNSVSVTDTATGLVVGTTPVGGYPLDIAFSPDGSRAYTANFYGSSVSVIDMATRTVLQTIAVGTYPSGVGVSPDGSKLYVVRDYAGQIQIRDTATYALQNTILTPGTNGGFGSVTFTPDGSRAYVTGWAITVLDVATDQVQAQFSAGFCADLAITPDGSRVYCSDGWQGAVYGFDTATHTLQSTTVTAGLPGPLAITRDGSKAFVTVPAYLAGIQGSFAAAPQRVMQTMNLATNQITATFLLAAVPGGVARTIDGTRMCIGLPSLGQVVELDPVSNAVLTQYPAGPRPTALKMRPAPASATSYGSSCALPTGPVVFAATTLPWLGETHTATATGLAPTAFALGLLGFSQAALPLAGLLSFGVPGCDLSVQPVSVQVLANVGGAATMATALPANGSLIGAVLFEQVLPLDTTGLGASNGLRLVFGMR
jgi:YVTN family beta-propeller protein